MRVGEGSEVAGYRLDRFLGAGGYGEVYLAKHPRLPRYEALKLLKQELSADSVLRARFHREVHLAAGLDHPNIVTIYDGGVECVVAKEHSCSARCDHQATHECNHDCSFADHRLWMSMQYIDGKNVDELRDSDPAAMTPQRAVHIITETAKALDYAHGCGVLHRDVKPANILCSKPQQGQPERVLLADFGIATALDGTTRLTGKGDVVASLPFAAPERFLPGKAYDHRGDVYSVGCTFFWLLTGTTPFAGNHMAQMNGHLYGKIPLPSQRASEPGARDRIPAGFDAVIRRALAKDPSERYPNCESLAADARQVIAEYEAKRSGSKRNTGFASDSHRFATTAINPVPPPQQNTLPLPEGFHAFGIAVDSRDNVYVGGGDRLLRFGPDLHHWVDVPSTDLRDIWSVAVDLSGNLFVVDQVEVGRRRVIRLEASTNRQTTAIQARSGLASVAISPDGRTIYTTASRLASVEKFRRSGSSSAAYELHELHSSTPPRFGQTISTLAVDKKGRLHVSMPYSEREQSDPRRNIMDRWNYRIEIVRGGILGTKILEFDGFDEPRGIAVSSNGDVFVADPLPRQVLRIPAHSQRAATVVPFENLKIPYRVAVNSSGDVFVVDVGKVLWLPVDAVADGPLAGAPTRKLKRLS